MLALKISLSIFIAFSYILFNIFLVRCLLEYKALIQYMRNWKDTYTDRVIIVVAICFTVVILSYIFLFFDKVSIYEKEITLMGQTAGFILALVAATIAFRNYLRKSGDKLSYIAASTNTDIRALILRNEKDKSTSLFAIDIVLTSKERIRLVNFFWPIINPLNLSAFETKKIDLGKVHLYGDKNPRNFKIREIKKLICITANGESFAETFPVDSLRPEFVEKEKVLLANRIKNIVSGYENKDIDPAAEYWLYFEDGGSINGSSWEEEHVLTGFLSEHVFYLTKDSINYINKPNKTALKQYCLENIHAKKVAGKYSLTNKAYDESGEYLINGFFWEFDWYRTTYQADDYSYCILEKIEKIEINNSYD